MNFELNLQKILDELLSNQTYLYDLKSEKSLFQSKIHELDVLLELSSLEKMLYVSNLLLKRYMDEYSKIRETEDVPSENLIDNIQNQIKIILEIIILIESYTKIVDNPQKFKIKKSCKTQVELVLNQIIEYLLSNADLTEIIGKSLSRVLELDKHQSYERLVDDNQSDEISNLSYYTYFVSEREFWLELINSYLQSIIDDWWYEDYVLFKILGSRIVEDFEQTITKFDQLKRTSYSLEFEKFKNVDYRVVQCIQLWYDSRVMLRDLYQNLWEEHFSTCVELLRAIIKKQEKIFLIIGSQPSYPQFTRINMRNQSLYNKSLLMKPVIEQSNDYYLLKQAIQSGNDEEIRFSLNQLLDKLEEKGPEVEIPYLSSFPALFDFLATSTNFMLELDKSNQEILDHNNQLFENFITRLQNGLKQIVREITTLSDNASGNLTERLDSLNNEIDQLKLAILLLPPLTESKEKLKELIRTVDLLVQSLILENKSSATRKIDILKRMIYKLKAFHFAKVALDSQNLPTGNEELKNRIKAQMMGSYITANILQIDIYRPVIQYICINNLLPDLLILHTQDVPIIEDRFITLEHWKQKFNDTQGFVVILKNIIDVVSEIKNHQSDLSQQLRGINLSQLNNIQNTAQSALFLYTAVKNLGLGLLALKLGILEDAVINFEDAKTSAFAASEELQPHKQTELHQFSTQIYSFAQFCQNAEQHPSLKSFEDFSPAMMLKMFREVVFSI